MPVAAGHLGKMLAAGASASPATLPELLDRVQPLDARAVAAVRHELLTFDEFVSGTEIFGTRIQPLMQSRRHIASPHTGAAQ